MYNNTDLDNFIDSMSNGENSQVTIESGNEKITIKYENGNSNDLDTLVTYTFIVLIGVVIFLLFVGFIVKKYEKNVTTTED